MTGMLSAMAVVLLVLLGTASLSMAEVCHITDPIQRQECADVSMFHGSATQIHQSVLRQLCEAGHRHVLLKGAKPSQYQNLPPTSPRRAEQFAVINIHRDDFSEKVIWKSGEAVDIMCNDNWFVDEEVKLSNGYHWYRHGLPLWPLLNQTLVQKKKGLLSRAKKIDWPNYAIATPFYLVPNEIYNSRDPNLSIQKLFAGDLVQSALPNGQDTFANSAGFKDRVTNLYQSLFLDQAGYARKDINEDFDIYTNWLHPLISSSLQPMLESFLRAQVAPKRGQAVICPDELYIFFHQKPCSSSNSCLLLNEFQLALKVVNCPDTSIVAGFGMHGEVITEEIVPVKTLRKSQSMPQSGKMPSSALRNSYAFQAIWYLFILLGIRMSSIKLFL